MDKERIAKILLEKELNPEVYKQEAHKYFEELLNATNQGNKPEPKKVEEPKANPPMDPPKPTLKSIRPGKMGKKR